jgi:hypothetical protein
MKVWLGHVVPGQRRVRLWIKLWRLRGYSSWAAIADLLQAEDALQHPKLQTRRLWRSTKRSEQHFVRLATQRGERIPAGVMNFIVWKFLQVYETLGNAMVDEHLAYELEKYAREGLRDDYKRDLYLF